MQVSNMTSNNGNKVANQFIITDGATDYFQSYRSMIVKRVKGQVYLDEHYWDYSVTTSRYRNKFLNENTKETQKKIKDGTYILTNLNQEVVTMTDKQLLWLLCKDMTTTQIDKYNLDHGLVGRVQLTRQLINSWKWEMV